MLSFGKNLPNFELKNMLLDQKYKGFAMKKFRFKITKI
jgi:hypothetical protein